LLKTSGLPIVKIRAPPLLRSLPKKAAFLYTIDIYRLYHGMVNFHREGVDRSRARTLVAQSSHLL
jgi:hypothetical protein